MAVGAVVRLVLSLCSPRRGDGDDNLTGVLELSSTSSHQGGS